MIIWKTLWRLHFFWKTNIVPPFCLTKVFLIFQDLSKPHVSVCPGCCNKDSIDWIAYKQYTFISTCFRGCEVQDQGASRCFVWWRHASWFIVSQIVWVLSRWKGGQEFSRALVPFLTALSSWPIISQRPHLQISTHWGARFHHMNVAGTCAYSMHLFQRQLSYLSSLQEYLALFNSHSTLCRASASLTDLFINSLNDLFIIH